VEKNVITLNMCSLQAPWEGFSLRLQW